MSPPPAPSVGPDRHRTAVFGVLLTLLPLAPLALGALGVLLFGLPDATAGRVLALVGLGALLAASVALQLARERSRARERRSLREAALQAERARRELLANVGHELRTPLAAILGMTELATHTPLTPEQREYLESAHRSARQLRELVDDLLEISQLEEGTLALRSEAFSLPTLVGETARAFLPAAREKGLELLCDIESGAPDGVRGDAARLRQVLSLLVDNALRFTDAGRVTVVLHRAAGEGRAGRVHLSVADTGVGIALSDRERVFEPFAQVDGSATRRQGGAGLGLAVAARLVRAMGGSIRLESVPGSGSTFRMELDLPEDPAGNVTTERDLEGLQDRRVLVLDRQDQSRETLGEILRSLAVRPTLTEDPALAHEALVRAASEGDPFAAMFVDPRVRGSVAFRAQRAGDDSLVAATPRVLLESAGDRPWGGRTGPSPRLTRPLTRPEVLSALRRALAAPASGVEMPTPPVTPLRVLVAEDNPVNAFMAAKMLERLGHRARVVGTGGQAVTALGGEDFDVVLMDVQMPEMDGLEATRRIREAERERDRRVRVLAMTAVGEKGEEGRCRAAGMDGVLAKPFTLESLAAALRVEPVARTPEEGGGKAATFAEGPALDRERLAVQLGGDAEAVTEVLRSFVEEGPRTLKQLRDASGVGDAKGVERAAHRLKGALRWITGDVAAAHAEAVESRARSGHLDRAQSPLDELVREVDRVLEEARSGDEPNPRSVSAFGTGGPGNEPEGSPERGNS